MLRTAIAYDDAVGRGERASAGAREWVMEMLVGDLIRRNAQLWPERPAWSQGGQGVSWAEANRRVNAIAHALLGIGLRPGDRVAYLGQNSLALAEWYFAVAKVGLVAVPLQATMLARELAYVLRNARAAAVLVDEALAEQANAARALLPEIRWWIGVGSGPARGVDGQRVGSEAGTARREGQRPIGETDTVRQEGRRLVSEADTVRQGVPAPRPALPLALERLVSEASSDEPTVVVPETAIRAINYTNGKNAALLGCVSTHRQLLQSVVTYTTQLPFTPEDVCLLALPMTAGVGAHLLIAYAYAGASTVILPTAEPAALLAAVEEHRATRLHLSPTLLEALLAHGDFGWRDRSSLRLVGWSSPPTAPPALVREAAARFGGQRLYRVYGTAETGGFVAYLPPGERDPGTADGLAEGALPAGLGAIGREAPFVRLRVADADGREVPRGALGELLVRADSVMSGYWDAPRETEQALRDGWLHTGELASMDAAGYVSIVDRKLELALSGYDDAATEAVELALRAHPSVQTAAATRAADGHWGTSLRALVLLREGAVCTSNELVEHCYQQLASRELAAGVGLLRATARGDVARLLLRELQDRYWPRGL